MTQPNTDPVAVYESAVEQARKIMAGVKPDQMKDSIPCAEWDVAALLDHMTKAQVSIGGTLAGRPVAPGATPPLETLDAAASATLEAVKSPGGLEKKVQARQGEVAASQLLGGACMDLTVHTWDLAKATAQDTRLDPKVVELIFPIIERSAVNRGPNPCVDR